MRQLIVYSLDKAKDYEAMERRIYNDVQIKAAAEGIFNTLDSDLKEKYTPKQIFNLIKKTDKNNDGIITIDEAKADIDNIFGLKISGNVDKLDKIQTSVNKNLELADIMGLKNGLETWTFAKPIVIKHTTTEGLKEMFSNRAAVKYYSEKIGNNTKNNKNLVELFKAKNISVNDIKKMGFSEKVLKDILRLYEED